jgi:uncharacterized protein (TIRG00374 family)
VTHFGTGGKIMKIKINGNSFKIEFKKLIWPILLLLVIVAIFFKFSELKEIGNLVMKAKWYWLGFALISQVLNYLLQTSTYIKNFNILKLPQINFSKMVKMIVTTIFMNFTIPSLSLAGNLWLVKKINSQGIKEGKSILVIIMQSICYYIAFSFLLILCFIYLFFNFRDVGSSQKIAIFSFIFFIILVVGLIYFFIGNKEKAKKRVRWLAEKIDKTEDGVSQNERVENLLKDFYEDFDWVKKNKKKLISPIILQFFKFLSDGLTIFFVFLAFGSFKPFVLAVIAFAFGRLFSLITFIPGGIGTFEGSSVLLLNSLGVSLELAVAVILVYRFFSYWLYIPLGLVFYRQLEKQDV